VTSEIAAEGEIVNATPLGSDPHYMEFTSSVLGARAVKAVIALGASADRKMVSELSKPSFSYCQKDLRTPMFGSHRKGSWHGCHKYNPFWMSSFLIQKMYMHKTLKSSWLPYKSLTPTLKSSGVLFCDSASGFHLCGAGLWLARSGDFGSGGGRDFS